MRRDKNRILSRMQAFNHCHDKHITSHRVKQNGKPHVEERISWPRTTSSPSSCPSLSCRSLASLSWTFCLRLQLSPKIVESGRSYASFARTASLLLLLAFCLPSQLSPCPTASWAGLQVLSQSGFGHVSRFSPRLPGRRWRHHTTRLVKITTVAVFPAAEDLLLSSLACFWAFVARVARSEKALV